MYCSAAQQIDQAEKLLSLYTPYCSRQSETNSEADSPAHYFLPDIYNPDKCAQAEAYRVDEYNIIPTRRCTAKGNKGDGRRDSYTGRWEEYKCVNKTCPRHWRRYARRKYHAVKAKLGKFPNWYHIRLSCKRHIRPGERFQALDKFVGKLRSRYGTVQVISIAHRNRAGDHFHLIVGTDLPLEADDIQSFWRSHFPAKRTTPYRRNYAFLKAHNSPRGLLWYALMGKREKPRTVAPWTGIPLRSPVKVFRKTSVERQPRPCYSCSLLVKPQKKGSEAMSILAAVGALEEAFHELIPIFPNEEKFGYPVITIQTMGRKRNTLGWFCSDKWTDTWEGRMKAEINICAECLDRPILEVLHTLTHEMVHYSNNLDKINDCSSNQYHNARFAERCRAVGLIPEKGYRGWSTTTISPDLMERLRSIEIDEEVFTLFRGKPEREKLPTKLKKWRCSCTNVRVAVDLDATCNRCGGLFVKQG